MNQHRADRDFLPALLAALLGIGMAFSAVAQEQDLASSNESSEDIEELTVVAPKALESMRQELVIAEDDVLSVFNALNDDDQYDIYCTEERPTGSYIPVRVCRARFVDTVSAQNAYDFLSGTSSDLADPTGQLRNHEAIMRQKMSELAAENPTLYNALRRYYDLKTEYDEERASRFEDQFFAR